MSNYIKPMDKLSYLYQSYVDDALEDVTRRHPNAFIISGWEDTDDNTHLDTKIRCHELLDGCDVAPQILDHGYLASVKLERTWDYKCMALARCGVTVAEKYIPKDIRDNYCEGTGVCVDDSFLDNPSLHDVYGNVPECVPDGVITKIEEILCHLIEEHSIYHQNVHLGNFLVDDNDRVRVIGLGRCYLSE